MNDGGSTVVEFLDAGVHLPDGQPIVGGLRFRVRRGEALVLLGRSGSGKTTTLKLINRLVVPTEGDVRVEGRSTREWPATELRRRIGYVIQDVGLFPHFTIERNVGLVPALQGRDPDWIRERTRELLALVDLDPDAFAGRYPAQLSGGQRQRVGVARALAADPPLLLMDEPFGALDPMTRLELQRELRGLLERLDKTMVFVTHDVREGLYLADRIGLLARGRLVFLGPPDEFHEAENPEARAFVDALRDPTEARRRRGTGEHV